MIEPLIPPSEARDTHQPPAAAVAPEPAPQPRSRVSAEARQAALAGWLLAGLGEEEIVELAQATWPVRAGQVRRDLEAIRSRWAAEDEGEDQLEQLRFAKRQRSRLLSQAMLLLEKADPASAARLLALCHKLMRERDQLADRIFELKARAQRRAAAETEAAPPLPTPAALPPSLAKNRGSAFPTAGDLAALAGAPADWLTAELDRQGGLTGLNAARKPREGPAQAGWPAKKGASKSAQAPHKSAPSSPFPGMLSPEMATKVQAELKDTAFCPVSVTGNR